MYTLCWTGNGVDGWDIFHSVQELENKVRELIKEGFSEENMMIFNTRDYIVPVKGNVLIH